MSSGETAASGGAKLDFNCLTDGCEGLIVLDLENVADPDFQAVAERI